MTGMIALEVYGKSAGELTETEKQTVSTLATLAAGLAGGLTGDSTSDAVAGAQAGQTTVNNNLFGGNEETQTQFVQEHGKDVLSCADDPSSASCQRGKAVNKAIAVALGAGAAGGAVVAATPELIAAAQAAASACGANPVLCANEVSIWVAEMVTGDALPAGLTVATVSKMSAKELSELKALMTVEKQTGSKVTKESLENVVTGSGSSKGSLSNEEVAANALKDIGNSTNINAVKNTTETQASVDNKLSTSLLEKEHPVGGSKAEWFDSALGFNKSNSNELAKQIVFDPSKAVKTTETQFGIKYDQVIPITGANGRIINVKFGWIKNNDGIVRLVTAIPAKK